MKPSTPAIVPHSVGIGQTDEADRDAGRHADADVDHRLCAEEGRDVALRRAKAADHRHARTAARDRLHGAPDQPTLRGQEEVQQDHGGRSRERDRADALENRAGQRHALGRELFLHRIGRRNGLRSARAHRRWREAAKGSARSRAPAQSRRSPAAPSSARVRPTRWRVRPDALRAGTTTPSSPNTTSAAPKASSMPRLRSPRTSGASRNVRMIAIAIGSSTSFASFSRRMRPNAAMTLSVKGARRPLGGWRCAHGVARADAPRAGRHARRARCRRWSHGVSVARATAARSSS